MDFRRPPMIATGVVRQNLNSTGNETLDKFLGGGLLNSTLNLFERYGPSSRILDVILTKSIAATTLTEKSVLLYVNFDSSKKISKDDLLSSLPTQRKVKSELLYKDIRSGTAEAKIKIAWRYSSRGTSSPVDGIAKVEQVDFGTPLTKTIEQEDLGCAEVLNFQEGDALAKFLSSLRRRILELKKSNTKVNIIIKDLLHPFSPIVNDVTFSRVIYALRCMSRLVAKGAIVAVYDTSLCENYSDLKQQLYNASDSVISFHSYETDENLITGYKDIDGSITYTKVPKISSFGFHFQQELSDWGYRVTKNMRFLVVDELSLPPCEDDSGSAQDTKTPVGVSPKDQTKTVN